MKYLAIWQAVGILLSLWRENTQEALLNDVAMLQHCCQIPHHKNETFCLLPCPLDFKDFLIL